MVYFATTIDSMIEALEAFKKVYGGDTPVSTNYEDGIIKGKYVDKILCLELVFVDEDDKIVGSEGDNYQANINEMPVVNIN